MKWEEKVARLPLLPLAHREWTGASASEVLLVWRPLVSLLSFETFGLCFTSFDFWRLSLHTLM